MNKKYLISIVVLILFVFSLFYFYKIRNFYPGVKLAPVIVELNEDGFTPNEITILRGQSVTWKTTRGKQFWPASNLHPSHTLYPEFDPLNPVPADQTWTFRFDKIGSWIYHDHLSPYYKGKVNVLAK